MAPPATPAHHSLTRAIARALRQRCGIATKGAFGGIAEGVSGAASGDIPRGVAGDHLLIAVSGGADSVALLRALHALAPRRRWRLRLTVGHVQHHLRGDAAERDARFVEALANQLSLPLQRVDLQPPQRATNIEAWARRQRYAALARMAHECGATHVATAHHADDQLETLLLRLLRGTGTAGLRGIAWTRSFEFQGSRFKLPETEMEATAKNRESGPRSLKLVRPMLGVTREDVLAFLEAIGQTWCEDHTNADVTRDRARLRSAVLPVLRDIQPDAAQKATRLADHARDVHRLVQRQVRRQYQELVCEEAGTQVMERDAARALPRVVLTGVLRRMLREAGVPRDRLTRRAVTPMVRAVRDRRGGERRFELARGVTVVVTKATVRVGA